MDNKEKINGVYPDEQSLMEDFVDEIQKPEKPFDVYSLFKENKHLEDIANEILGGSFDELDIKKKEPLDKFLDFVLLKVRTGELDVVNMAYPSKRIQDRVMEKKIIELINVHLQPEIIIKILKYFARNVHDSDTNLYLANLITSESIIRSIFDTFQQFKKDILESDPHRRTKNVKTLQQFPQTTPEKYSSPLDAACRLKYVLEFIALKQDVSRIYTKKELSLSGIE